MTIYVFFRGDKPKSLRLFNVDAVAETEPYTIRVSMTFGESQTFADVVRVVLQPEPPDNTD